MTDREAVARLLGALAPATALADHCHFVAAGPPRPWQRARRRPRGGFYTASATRSAEDYVGLLWRQRLRGRLLVGPQVVVGLFFLPTHRWIDADNLMKLVLDSGNKAGIWRDDSQVVAQASVLGYDSHAPRSVIAFCPTTSTLRRHAKKRESR